MLQSNEKVFEETFKLSIVRTIDKIITKVNCKYVSPMGRCNVGVRPTDGTKIFDCYVPFIMVHTIKNEICKHYKGVFMEEFLMPYHLLDNFIKFYNKWWRTCLVIEEEII